MFIAEFVKWHLPLTLSLALAACGGGDGSSTGIVAGSVAVVGTAPTESATPSPTPTPAVTATPTATVTDTSAIASPSLEGLEPVASRIDITRLLVPAWSTGVLPRVENPGVEGAFRFSCTPSHNAYDDPIIYPGQPGRSHLHTFFGNTAANASSTYASLRTTGESTCNNALNRSSYWIPSMMHPSGKVVMPNWISIYYKRAPEGSIYCKEPYAKACLPLPRGLRYIFGYNMADPSKSSPDYMQWFNCDGTGAVSGHFKSIKAAAQGCPTGAMLGMLLVGPNCWNGKELDTADHRSHMAYQYYDGVHGAPVCPSTHPYLLPFFETSSWYFNDGTAAQWKLSSDIAMGMEGGASAHADWFGAWEDKVQDMWSDNCIDKSLSCTAGDLGNGWQIATSFEFPRTSVLVAPPAKP